jgi:glycosyltransferase involved in cell wall biosynthesis
MLASVVISYYKNIANLEILLLALNNQSSKKTFEVIISEDDDAVETKNFISEQQSLLSFPLIHVSQSDEGFRKCKALNRAIAASSTDFIIFLDGDCIPHRHLVKQYLLAKQPGRVMYGRRVMLSKKISTGILHNKNMNGFDFINLLLTGCKRVEEGLYLPFVPQIFKRKNAGRLLGCNMGIFKQDLLSINGFDEDYIFAGGGEDSDIEWRLEALKKLSFYSMKFSAIVYHLYHTDRFTREMELKNNLVLSRKVEENHFVCINGINKLDNNL